MSSWRPRMVVGLVVMLAIPLPVVLRVASEGAAEMDLAKAQREAGDVDLEILHLGRAARWRVWAVGHQDAALDRLLEIGVAAEAEGDSGRVMALGAYREVRSSILGTRSWGVPDPGRVELANLRIAALMAAQEREYGTDVSGTGDPEAYHLALLREFPGPDPLRANLAAIAFVVWVGTTVGFVRQGVDARGRLQPRPALAWGVAALASLIAWTVLLRYSG